jgi:hypothetical protein
MDDHLDSIRRMGREGQTAIGLSVQEQGAYDRGRRERDQLYGFNNPNANSGNGVGAGGIGVLFLLAMIAPAFAAPGVAVWLTWTWLASTQGWEWPALTAICIAEAVAILFVLKVFYDRTPAIIVAVVTSLYLSVAYAICIPFMMGTSFAMTAVVAMGTGAAGFLAGLTAPNKWMSSTLIASGVAIGLGAFVNLAPDTVLPYELYPLFAPIKWAGAGLALGGLLRLVFLSEWAVLGAGAAIAAMAFFAPDMLSMIFVTVIGAGLPYFVNP